jgi:hypothetical protein
LTNPDNTNIINFDLWKQAAGGRHQIGTLAGFKSEQVAGFLLECMAGFVGIRTLYCNVALMDGSAVMGGANGGGLDHAVFRRGRGKI